MADVQEFHHPVSQSEVAAWFDATYRKKGLKYLRPPRSYPIFVQLSGVRSGDRLLDVACGPGLILRAAMERGVVASGIDISQQAIDLARDVLLPEHLTVVGVNGPDQSLFLWRDEDLAPIGHPRKCGWSAEVPIGAENILRRTVFRRIGVSAATTTSTRKLWPCMRRHLCSGGKQGSQWAASNPKVLLSRTCMAREGSGARRGAPGPVRSQSFLAFFLPSPFGAVSAPPSTCAPTVSVAASAASRPFRPRRWSRRRRLLPVRSRR